MNSMKRAVQWSLSRLGFRLVRVGGESTQEAANLRHLAVAYEYLMNCVSSGPPLQPDETRLQLLGRLLGTPPPEAYAIAQALVRTAAVAGDVCEFGVAQGETSAFIANEILDSSRRLHLFDSFEGLPEPSDRDSLKDDIFDLGSIEAYAGTMACPEDMVVARLAAVGFPEGRYTVHRGFFEELVQNDSHLPSVVSFAFVDFDFYEPIKMALEFLDHVLSVGGVVIVDDYDFFSTGSKRAIDEFVEEANARERRYDIEVVDRCLGCFAALTHIDQASSRAQ